jgi:hypothetical protein
LIAPRARFTGAVCALALATVLAGFGCGSDSKRPAIPPPMADRPETSPEEGGRGIAVRDRALQFSMSIINLSVRAGEPIAAELAIRNMYLRPAKIVFPNGQRFDLIVTRDPEGEDIVGEWSQGQSFMLLYSDVMLKTNEVISRRLEIATGEGTQTEDGALMLPPGRYYIRGTTASDPLLRTPGVGVTVLPAE